MTGGDDKDTVKSAAMARFDDVAAAFQGRPNVGLPQPTPASSARFGSPALKVAGKIFAMLVRGELVVKLPKARVDELVKSGAGRPFGTGAGRVLREWVSIPLDSAADWHALAAEAHGFVGPPE